MTTVTKTFAADSCISTQKVEVWRTSGTGWTDYTTWLYAGNDDIIVKTHPLNGPQTLSLSFEDSDAGFQAPVAGNRVRVSTLNYGIFFTGYVTATPKRTVLGQSASGNPVYGYAVTAVSEELALEWQTGSIYLTLAPFVNKTQGQIVKGLLAALSSSLGTANVDDGILIPYFRVRPDESFSDTILRLTDATSMKFWTKAGQAWLKSYSDLPFGYSPDETEIATRFNPSALDISPVTNPVYNDVLGTGDPEPQVYCNEYFVGDGLTAIFPLKLPLYGAVSGKLLDDDWTESSIDANKWTETDPAASINLSGGVLQFNATTPSSSSRITSAQGVQLAGSLRLIAGRIAFMGATDAIIGGLFSTDSGLLADCICGFRATPSGSVTQLQPIINGVAVGPTLLTTNGEVYRLQVNVDCPALRRRYRSYSSLANSYGGANVSASAVVTFSVLHLGTGASDTGVKVLGYTSDFISVPTFSFYTLVAGPLSLSNNVKLQFSLTSLYNAVYAQVFSKRAAAFGGGFAQSDTPWTTFAVTLTSNSVIAPDGTLTATKIVGTGSDGYIGRSVDSSLIADGKTYVFGVWLRVPSGTSLQSLTIRDNTGAQTIGDFTLSPRWKFYQIKYAPAPGFTGISLYIGGYSRITTGVEVDYWGARFDADDWKPVTLSDVNDPGARAAITAQTDGTSALSFFGDSAPVAGEKIRVRYRSAGIPRVRVQRASSITSEAAKAGDSGVRTGLLPQLNPAPANSYELERAIQAFIDDHTTDQYQGQWIFDSNAYPPSASAPEPIPGRFMTVNVPTRHASSPLTVLVTQVEYHLKNVLPNGREMFDIIATFSVPTTLEKEKRKFQPPDDALQGQLDSVQTTAPVEFNSVGTTFSSDRPLADFDEGITSNYFEIDLGTAPDESVEVRKSDQLWASGSVANAMVGELISDHFSGSALSSAWVVTEGTFSVASGSVVQNTGGADNYASAAYGLVPLPADHYSNAQLTVTAGAASAAFGVAVRMSLSAETYYAFYVDNGVAYIFKNIAGTVTVLASVSYTPAINDILMLTVQGNELTAYVNYAVKLMAYDSTLTSGYPGIVAHSGANPKQHLKNFASGPGNPYFQTFKISRNSSDVVAFLRNEDNSGLRSRYSSMIRVAWPGVPSQPSASVTTTDNGGTLVTIDPSILSDDRLYGVEIRLPDGATVLYTVSSLTLTADALIFRLPATVVVPQTLNVYAFNLLGEYSSPYVAAVPPTSYWGVPVPANGGANLFANPGFELLTASPYPSSPMVISGNGFSFCDGWIATAAAGGNYSAEAENTSNQRTGVRNAYFRLNAGVAFANGATLECDGSYGAPSANRFFPARGGETFYLGGYIKLANSLPAGFVFQAYVFINFYNANGTFISQGKSASITSDTGGAYKYVYGLVQLPSNTAFISIGTVTVLLNSTGSTYTPGSVLFEARYDDLFCYLSDMGGNITYRPLSNPLTATDAGSTTTVSIASFTQRSPGKDLSVNSGSISSLGYSTIYYIYYDDTAFSGGSVVFQATTTKETAISEKTRFFVGSIQTPYQGGPATVGNGDGGSGAQYGGIFTVGFSTSTPFQGGTGVTTNAGNAIDGDPTTYCEMSLTGDGNSGNGAEIDITVPTSFNSQQFAAVQVRILAEIVTNTLSGGTGSTVIFAKVQGYAPFSLPINVPVLASYTFGQTAGLQYYYVTLSPGSITYNTLKVILSAGGTFGFAPASGSLVFRVHDVTIVGTF